MNVLESSSKLFSYNLNRVYSASRGANVSPIYFSSYLYIKSVFLY
jgi:hypothetical protein